MEFEEDSEKIGEELLVARLKRGDREAFQSLVRRYYSRLYTCAFSILLNKEDAEDVLQEALAKIFCSISSFKGESALYTWMYRVVQNLALDSRRRSMRRTGNSLDQLEDRDICLASPRQDSPVQALLNRERMSLFGSAVKQLSEDHRAVILMREIDGLSYEEISGSLGVSVGTVMSRLFYARKNLQKQLENLGWKGADDSVPQQEGGVSRRVSTRKG